MKALIVGMILSIVLGVLSLFLSTFSDDDTFGIIGTVLMFIGFLLFVAFKIFGGGEQEQK